MSSLWKIETWKICTPERYMELFIWRPFVNDILFTLRVARNLSKLHPVFLYHHKRFHLTVSFWIFGCGVAELEISWYIKFGHLFSPQQLQGCSSDLRTQIIWQILLTAMVAAILPHEGGSNPCVVLECWSTNKRAWEWLKARETETGQMLLQNSPSVLKVTWSKGLMTGRRKYRVHI